MENRYKSYKTISKTKRKLFSEVQKRIIACKQKYRCVGYYCKGDKLLPSSWELDHIVPLFMPDSSNELSNLQVLCSSCHAYKSQKERVEFYAMERAEKYKMTNEDFVSAAEYYANKDDGLLRYEDDQGNQQTIVLSRYFHQPNNLQTL